MVLSVITLMVAAALSTVAIGTALALPQYDSEDVAPHGDFETPSFGYDIASDEAPIPSFDDLTGKKEKYVDYHSPAKYEFEYKVNDPHSGDAKAQYEHRDGDDVKGYYTLKEADGTVREVHYTANHKDGFNAIVKKTGRAVHPHVYGDNKE